MAALRCQGAGGGGCSRSHFVPPLPPPEHRRRRKPCEPTADVRQRTMECARSAFHAQLAAVMDSLLAAAVCEIAKIFESSLCEQQAELVQRAEEVSILRGELEKAERRQRARGPGEDAGDALTGSGLNVEEDAPGHGFRSQSLSGLKEEVTGQDGASVKHECAGSQPDLGSVAVQTERGSLTAGDQRHKDTQTKISQWDQDSRSADHRPLQDQTSTPFLSISQSGRCSPRPDPSLAQPGEWLPGLEHLQAGGTGCPGPAGSSTGTDTPCFRPGFGPEETGTDDDDSSFPFLDQQSENQHADQNSAQGPGVGERDARQDQPHAPTGESPWRLRDGSGGRDAAGQTRRVTTLGLRDPLRSQTLTLRQSNALGHPAAPSGGNGRPYTCPYCAKCFTYPSHQRRHLLRHTGIRLHPCQFCDKSFLTPSELTVHTRTHTGERPFGCAQCGKRFARSGNLTAHQRDVHMRKRPFACTECGKRFANRRNLRVHNHRVHKGDPYYMDDQPEPDIGPNPI